MAIILVFCLWSVCLVDYAKPGIFDRAGNIKFQDFLQFPISARLIASGHGDQLYDDEETTTRSQPKPEPPPPAGTPMSTCSTSTARKSPFRLSSLHRYRSSRRQKSGSHFLS